MPDPLVALASQQNAPRPQHPHQFRLVRLSRIADNQQIDQVIRIRQMPPVPEVDADRAVQPLVQQLRRAPQKPPQDRCSNHAPKTSRWPANPPTVRQAARPCKSHPERKGPGGPGRSGVPASNWAGRRSQARIPRNTASRAFFTWVKPPRIPLCTQDQKVSPTNEGVNESRSSIR
jgi:hypothetical protein